MRAFDTVGAHVLADFWGCQFEKLDDAELLMNSLREAAKTANMTVLAEKPINLSPRVLPGFSLLAKKSYFHSHLSGTGLRRG